MIHHHPLFIECARKYSSLLSSTKASAQELRAKYHNQKSHEDLHAEYILSRMPSTYAAIKYVLQNLPSELETVLDLGCGPGTALIPCIEYFPNLKSYVGIDGDAKFIRLNKHVYESIPQANWQIHDYLKADLPSADVVLCSYTLGENTEIENKIKRLLDAASSYLVLIEPGTPKGFQMLSRARKLAMDLGVFVVAPCMGEYECPMKNDDWCHFSVSLQRLPEQQQFKKGSLSYEDEKVSYIVLSKTKPTLESAKRIIKKPRLRGKHMLVDLCSEKGYEKKVIGKSDDLYKAIKKKSWGDTL
jgi:ribosomal protein RSM22 (predicted rRNA methylase)